MMGARPLGIMEVGQYHASGQLSGTIAEIWHRTHVLFSRLARPVERDSRNRSVCGPDNAALTETRSQPMRCEL